MALTDARTSAAPARRPGVASSPDGFVLTAFTLVAAAVAVALHVQVGLALTSAVFGALMLQGALILLHVLVRRGEAAFELHNENARLATTLERLASGPNATANATGEPPADEQAVAGAPAMSNALATLKSRPSSAMPTGTTKVSNSAAGGAQAAPPIPSKWTLAKPADATRWSDMRNGTPAAELGPLAAQAQPPREAGASDIDPEQRIWEYRPGDKPLASLKTNDPAVPAGRAPPPPPMAQRAAVAPRTPERRPSDAGIEQIADLIKRLADDINSGRGRAQAAVSTPPGALAADQALERSVEALRTASHVMRGHAGAGDEAGRVVAGIAQGLDAGLASRPEPPSRPQRHATLTEALGQAQVDLFLEPILGFPDHRARHYEVSMRLRGGNGAFADPRQDSGVRASGLLPLLDAFKVSCAARIAQRLEERGSGSSLFSAICGETLTGDRLIADITEAAGDLKAIYSRLVITFPQSEARAFTPGHWSVIKDLAALGFSFGIDAVTDLDMSFDTLRAADFIYVKLDAPVFLDGLPAPGGRIPASDLCRHLAKLGLTVIVGRIEDEMQLARVLGFGVLFGQGTLFGAPRPVKADLVREKRGAAA